MRKVLYAEDEPTNRRIVEIRLRNEGIVCDVVPDGYAALDLVARNRYDLVILDQYMPGLNGDEVARIIKRDHPTIPLFAITSDDEEVFTLRAAGFSEVFIKPLNGRKFIDVVGRYVH